MGERHFKTAASQCRNSGVHSGKTLEIAFVDAGLLGPVFSDAAPIRLAQLGPNGGAGPSYGYQPYSDRNPTGFYRPNGTGYGHYDLTQKYHAPRLPAFKYRKSRGT